MEKSWTEKKEEINTQKPYKIIILIMIVGLLCYFAGYTVGFGKGVFWAVDIGLNFIDIPINETMIKNGIFNYQNHINNCFEKNELKNYKEEP